MLRWIAICLMAAVLAVSGCGGESPEDQARADAQAAGIPLCQEILSGEAPVEQTCIDVEDYR